MRKISILLVVITTLLGCSRKPNIESIRINEKSGEIWSYDNRHYVIFEENPSITKGNLIRAGYVFVHVDDRPMPEFESYPGRFGIGIDKRNTADVFNKGASWVIISDGRLTAEIIGTSPKDILKEMKTLGGKSTTEPVSEK